MLRHTSRELFPIHSTAMGTKMAVAFANIFMADIKTEILCKSVIKQLKGCVE